MDQRGRMYYRGGLLTPQGEDVCKAAFQFANGEALGPRGEEAMMTHLANVLGKDKVSIHQRIEYIRDLQRLGTLDKVSDHYDVQELFPKASTFQALVAIKEWQRFMEFSLTGNPEEFVSTLVCHQDGTCNGLQHTAAITGDRRTAESVNCTASTEMDSPEDIYWIVVEAAMKLVDGDALALLEKYERSIAKAIVMLASYGAGEDTLLKTVPTFLEDHGESTAQAEIIGGALLEALGSNAGAVKTLTSAIKRRMVQFLNEGGTVVRWTCHDGFEAATEYRDMEVNRVRAGKFNALVRNMFPAPLDDVKTKGAMAPNFVHSIDSAHLREVVRQCDHELVTVHDSIGSLPSRFHETKAQIQKGFVTVHEYDALGNLCNTNGLRAPKFRGDYKASEAMNSTYIFS